MNIQTKSSVLVLSIFIFGIICGFFLRSVFVNDQFRKPPFERGKIDFSKRLEDVLRLNPAQAKAVEPILKKYDQKILLTIDKARLEGVAVIDSMKVELRPLLTNSQKEILNNELIRFKNPPPPPPNEPMN